MKKNLLLVFNFSGMIEQFPESIFISDCIKIPLKAAVKFRHVGLRLNPKRLLITEKKISR